MRPSPPLRSVCVFCGSRPGVRPAYAEAARALGREVARRGLTLVYGGGHVGLMGVVADAVLANGGHVVGVITRGLEEREVAHRALSELHVVETLHQRKALMAERADAFAVLPGGLGTFDELFEQLTWAQLGLHHKPVGLLDTEGYFGPLHQLVRRAAAEGFVPVEGAESLLLEADPVRLLERLATAPPVPAAPDAPPRPPRP